jgi:hypothetical protein
MRTPLAGGVLIAVAFVALACGNGGKATPVVTPLSAANADCVHRPDGSLDFSDGPTLCFWPEDADAGDTITVTATGWRSEEPIRFFLLTEEQANLRFTQLRDADKVALGDIQPSSGDAVFEFVLKNEFETSHGNRLTIAPGDKLHVLAWQRTPGGSHGSSAGWISAR